MTSGTDQIADRLTDIAASRSVCFSEPDGAVASWLPTGYQLVTDPNHVVQPDDCIMPSLGNDWRLVATVNAGSRIGRCAKDIGAGVVYVATRKP